MIVAPTCVEDIILEGRALTHCIADSARYWDRIESRESYILFLRKSVNPPKAFYTLEIEPDGTIRQKRSKLNEQYKDIKQATSSCGKAPDRRRPFTCRAEPGSADGRIWTAAQGSGYCTHGNPVRETAWRCPNGRPHGKQQRNERLPVAYMLAPLSAGKGDALRRPLSFCFYIRKLRTQRRKTIHSS